MSLTADQIYAADALLSAIHDASEDLWCAGWYTDLEFILWSALLGDKRWPRASEVPHAARRHIAYLSGECAGWWVHCSTVGREWQECGGRVLLPLDEWRVLYASRVPSEE
jgi:hypothetical protein